MFGGDEGAGGGAAPGEAEEWRHMWGAKVKWPADMPDDVLRHAVECAQRLLEPIEDWQAQGDEVVQAFKKEFDEKYDAHWHIVIGKNFGSHVTHEARHMAYFYVGDLAVLLFRAG